MAVPGQPASRHSRTSFRSSLTTSFSCSSAASMSAKRLASFPGQDDEGRVLYDAGAGKAWDRFVAHAVMARSAGVECLSGIPGSVGGTPVQNVGAYGQEVSETIESVEVYDRKDGQVRELCREACGFTYRSSIFNTTERGRFIILRVTYALTPGGEAHLEYADLKRHFEGRETRPNLAETREAVRHIRSGASGRH